jgi:signal transduction histidine kinase
LPEVHGGERAPDQVFAPAEILEYQKNDSPGAAEALRVLCRSGNREVRAGALLRLARNLRKSGHALEALDVYGQLELVHDVRIEAVPAGLLALSAKCSVLESLGRREALHQEASRMDATLRTGRWSLPGDAWDFYQGQANRWAATGALTRQERQSLALSRAAEWIFQLSPHPLDARGRRILNSESGPVLVSWSAAPGTLSAILAGPDPLQSIWRRAYLAQDIRAGMVDADGNLVLGAYDRAAGPVARRAAGPGLADTLVFTPAGGVAGEGATIRRRLLLAAFAVLGLVLASGTYFILRSMERERAVARLQSEFVSAASHELRTPLTSLRQISEMLVSGRIAAEPERRQSYEVLFQATQRLQRLVESLLDFSRMEAAAFRYSFQSVDPRAMVDGVVEEFRRQVTSGHEIVVTHAAELPAIRADRDAIAVAVWNLLDNAVKYSPGRPAIRVETKSEGGILSIAVRDRGIGIDPADRDRIFERFVRGAASLKSNIKGTGIGLSIARHIVRAHGGEIHLESTPGEGSTFTIDLPVEGGTGLT